ncbi:MAG: DUF1415 domain-containing protein [Gammaproteobacteria bacterium]|nr:DUF1415 domain-containing protein [Gammaproteobacteria bacterium]
MSSNVNDSNIERQVKQWLAQIVIGERFCPFAKQPYEESSVRYHIVGGAPSNESLEQNLIWALSELSEEATRLSQDSLIETTLIIFPDCFHEFDDFLMLIDYSDEFIEQAGFSGIYQVAHFHPDYCFAGTAPDAAENFTNRSPYPILHLLREASLSQALSDLSAPENIPQRNIAHANKKGAPYWRARLQAIFDALD